MDFLVGETKILLQIGKQLKEKGGHIEFQTLSSNIQSMLAIEIPSTKIY